LPPSSFDDEETLSQAVMNYAALSAVEKREMVLQVKKAARNDTNLKLTTAQRKKLDDDIQQLSKN
jgi:hypothetical protein